MTIEAVKETMETMLPDNWEYCHDEYVDSVIEDEIDIEAMIREGFTVEEIAQEIIDGAIAKENREFKAARESIWDADGVEIDEDGVRVSDEAYTNEHMQELEQIGEEARREAVEDAKAERAMYFESFKW